MQNINDEEYIVTQNLVKVLEGVQAELAFACLSKAMEALLVGMAPDKGTAHKFVAKLSTHLKKEINKKKPDQFGYLKPDEKMNDPILAKE